MVLEIGMTLDRTGAVCRVGVFRKGQGTRCDLP